MSRSSRSRPGAGVPAPNPPRSTSPNPKSAHSAPKSAASPRSTTQRSAPPRPVTHVSALVPDGIDHNAQAISMFGPVAALIPMALSGLVSSIMLWGSQSTLRGAIGFALSVISCPTLPILGFPVVSGGTRWIIVVASSAVVWMAVGKLAARRATARAVAGWPEWRREWLRLAIGIWIGAFVGFAIAAILLAVDF